MRISSHMLNESLSKAGVKTQAPTLLDYMDSDSKSMFNLLSNDYSSTSSLGTSTNYSNMQKYSQALTDSLTDLASDDGSVAAAEESGDYSEVISDVKDMISNYNSVVKTLTTSGQSLELFYRNKLKEQGTENEDELNAVGITVNANGTFAVDSSKLEAADTSTLSSLFGKKSDFMEKMEYISGKVNTNAETNLESTSSTYSQSGSTLSNYISSKFDTKS